MNLTGVKPGDIVGCDVRGRKFLAFYDGKLPHARTCKVQPITPNINYFSVKTQEIVAHWRGGKGSPAWVH